MRPNLISTLSILTSQISSTLAIVSNHTASSLLEQPYVWYIRGLLEGGIIICTADIKGQEWILTTIGKDIRDNHVGQNSTLVLKEIYPVRDGEAIVGQFRLVERSFDFGAVIAPLGRV